MYARLQIVNAKNSLLERDGVSSAEAVFTVLQHDLGSHAEPNGVVDVGVERLPVVLHPDAHLNEHLRQVVKFGPTFGGELVGPDLLHLLKIVVDPVVLGSTQKGVLSLKLLV